MRRFLAELHITLTIWYRFAWRVWIFGILCLTLTGIAVGFAPINDYPLRYQISELGRLFDSVFLLGYTFNLFRVNRILFKPVASRHRVYHIEIRHRPSRNAPAGEVIPPSWRRSLALWWGIAWRESLLFFIGMSWFELRIVPPYPFVDLNMQVALGSIILLWMIFSSILAFWWFIFHPWGKTVLITKADVHAKP